MRQWLRWLIVLGAVFSAFAVGRLTQVQAQAPAQAPSIQPAPGSQPQAQSPTIISGNDIGFRVDQYKRGIPVGVLVVRVNGQWVEPEPTMGVKRLTMR